MVLPARLGPPESSASTAAMIAAGQSLFILGTHDREDGSELVLDLMSRVAHPRGHRHHRVDDIQLARFVSAALTTVRQPMRELGATAAEMLFERFAGARPDSAVLPSDVVVRASCGCESHSE